MQAWLYQSLHRVSLAIGLMLLALSASAASDSVLPKAVKTLQEQAQTLASQHDYLQANQRYEQGLAILLKTQSADTPLVQDWVIEQIMLPVDAGNYATAQGNYTQAQQAFSQAEKLANDKLATLPAEAQATPEQQHYRASLYFGLVVINMHKGNNAAQQGLQYKLQQETDKAENFLRQAVTDIQTSAHLVRQQGAFISQYHSGINLSQVNQTLAGYLTLLANFYIDQQRANEALTLLQQTTDLLKTQANDEHKMISLQAIAQAYRRIPKQLAQAEALLKHVLTYYQQHATEPTKVAFQQLYLGDFYREQQQWVEAQNYCQQALASARQLQDQELLLSGLIAQAALYIQQHQYTQAESLLHEAIALDTTNTASVTSFPGLLDASDYAIHAALLNQLGATYAALGQFPQAEQVYNQNLEDHTNTLAPAHPGSKTQSLQGLAKLYGLKQALTLALDKAQQAAADYANHPSGDQEQAQQQRTLAHLQLWIIQQGLHKQSLKANEVMTTAFQAMQQAHGSQRMQALQQTALQLTAADPNTRKQLQTLWQQQARLHQLDQAYVSIIGQTSDEAVNKTKQLQQDRQQTLQEIQQLDTHLRQNLLVYAQLLQPKALSIAEVQTLLKPDEALLVWVMASAEAVAAEHSTLMVIRAGHEPHLYTLNIRPPALSRALTDPQTGLLTALADPAKPIDLNLAYGLYQQLLAPAEAELVGVKHLLAVTDGVLQNLPLQVLLKTAPNAQQTYTDADWLVKHYAISYLPAVHSLAHLRSADVVSKPSAPLPFIGFGDPVLEGKQLQLATLFRGMGEQLQRGENIDFVADPNLLRTNLLRLPETAEELQSIARLLGAHPVKSLYLGEKATETHLKQLSSQGILQQYAIVSFATHALLPNNQADDPISQRQEAGLVLTPPLQSTPEDDGYLSASEAANLRLHADWLLLSACNTGTLDKAAHQEGLSQLAKAFFVAGTRSVLASHWSVNSQTTEQLMTRIFQQLAADKTLRRAEALRQSMLTLLQTPADCGLLCKLGWQEGVNFAHPAYWAPFVIYGEGGPMPERH